MNEDRTRDNSGTGLTQSSSRPVLYELIDKDGVRVATFTPPCLEEIGAYARARFPDQEQDEDRTGRGWDLQVVGS